MGVINSPLGALGALMILLEALAVGAIAALGSQPELQEVLVWTVVAIMCLMTVSIVSLIGYVAYSDITLLFDPRSFAESVQLEIYPGRRRPRTQIAPPQDLVSIVSPGVTEPETIGSPSKE